MLRKPLSWDNFKHSSIAEPWVDRLWLLGLLLAAGLLYSVNLGELPLRDWDEGTVAQVAREIWRSPFNSLTWLYPTLNGEPYFNKPPLMHWLIALAFWLGDVNEWTARLPGAMLTAFSVPLVYATGRELLLRRTPTMFAALVYLTLLPVVRHGRLAMLDGAVLCFFLLLVFCLLRTRRDLRWSVGMGLAFGLLCLTKGIVALVVGAIAIGFIFWDTPRLLTTGYSWLGVLIGSTPAIAWYGAQWLHYGQAFIDTSLLSQSLSRISTSVEGHRGPPWYYLLEVLKYGLPWLLFVPQGMWLAWENRNLGWAKLVLVWVGGYLLVISLMSTKLPWYVLPVYPALALAAGVVLADIWNPADLFGIHRSRRSRYPIAWVAVLSLVAIAAWATSVYFSNFGNNPKPSLTVTLLALALTLTIATMLIIVRDSQFILVLVWGMYLSLALLMASPYWIWELDEAYPVKPVAALIKQETPPDQMIWTAYPYYRPSLNFYSDRQVTPASGNASQITSALEAHWQQDFQPYLLVDQATLAQLTLPAAYQLGRAEGWILLTRKPTVANHSNPSAGLPLK